MKKAAILIFVTLALPAAAGVKTHTDISDRATFIAVEPCRLVDTRNANGAYGGPIFAATEVRMYDIPAGPCADIPVAAAYSLSFAVVSYSGPGWITAFPALTTLPGVSTVNYGASGPAVANAAIVPATSGSISVYSHKVTHVIVDINGYFIEPAGAITEVIAGDGLSGGGTTGDVTLNAGFAGSGTAETAARSDHTHYEQTIIVSPVGTAVENGDALAAAVTGITDNSPTKRYLVKIEPGVYDMEDVELDVPDFVHIEGSGRDATKITQGRLALDHGGNELRMFTIERSDIGFVINANNAISIRDATIRNSAPSNGGGVTVSGGAGRFDGVTIEIQSGSAISASAPLFVHDSRISLAATTGASNGLFVSSSSEIRSCTISVNATSGAARGIRFSSSPGETLDVSEVTITVSGTAPTAVGIDTVLGDPVALRNVTVNVTGTDAYGIRNNSSPTVTVADAQITTNGSTNTGIQNGQGAMSISNAFVSASGTALKNLSTATAAVKVTGGALVGGTAIDSSAPFPLYVGNARVEGTVTGTGTIKCAGAYDGSFAALDATCQ